VTLLEIFSACFLGCMAVVWSVGLVILAVEWWRGR
jgi:hypothetical protein